MLVHKLQTAAGANETIHSHCLRAGRLQKNLVTMLNILRDVRFRAGSRRRDPNERQRSANAGECNWPVLLRGLRT